MGGPPPLGRNVGMPSSRTETHTPLAVDVKTTHDTLAVELTDGRTISVPLTWYPRLARATSKERKHWRLIARGQGVHWPDLDEDVSVENLLVGKPSGESRQSFKRWLAGRVSATSKTKGRRSGTTPRSQASRPSR